MKLTAIPGNETKPQSINISTDNGNLFANINKFGELLLFGEDMAITHDEMKKALVIAENFQLFYMQLIRLQNDIQELLTPTIGRQ